LFFIVGEVWRGWEVMGFFREGGSVYTGSLLYSFFGISPGGLIGRVEEHGGLFLCDCIDCGEESIGILLFDLHRSDSY
jgi:hypothetical protein